ncbi:secreted cell wall surface anchor family protein [Phycomyces blakesleeanus]|uniref:Secreted cell wall surface anchor family protein n=2 Tax=Phycomyces blakesleeanus TaxID=4837 RepID=A0A162UZ69_PHYB8|nr:secreted cell wall surface anchor family protein [Phycomyces blakesleeanus NRRL 1555(-)]OAD78932.1 secreted cell wall surface anchor family protein [Phycomyces blakesleeanus NRRL 1555(-)]|eukprot:XP_018296972.1 secreted cell wall surface anchor family protein [Phycomyces blakesleeanus NRRL 1555(-)]
MKLFGVFLSAVLVVSLANAFPSEPSTCDLLAISTYQENTKANPNIQALIDDAVDKGRSVVKMGSGQWILPSDYPIVLPPGVSLSGDPKNPTVLTVIDKNTTGTILVPALNRGWTIKGLILDNVNILIDPHENDDETSILGNIFINGGRGSIVSNYGEQLYVDGNVFLRDRSHAGTHLIPNYNTTNTGVLFQTQKNSVISNNIFGMDLRQVDNLSPWVSSQLQATLNKLKFYTQCLGRNLDDQQGYLASAVQLYSTNDITIKENVMNATFPDIEMTEQDHGVSIVGSNQTYIYQNFIAGWQLGDFGGAMRFTSAVDGYVVSNYLANTAVMLYAAVHADFMQVSNMVVADNFLYRFMDPQRDLNSPVYGWLYEGITFFDFYTARNNYTIRPPIWNSSVPISPWGWNIEITHNKFAATADLDPNVISLGNLDLKEASVDTTNCYVTRPLDPKASVPGQVPVLWRQTYLLDRHGLNGARIPMDLYVRPEEDLDNAVPAHLRNLSIPPFWRAFTLKNNTQPMMDPSTPCI